MSQVCSATASCKLYSLHPDPQLSNLLYASGEFYIVASDRTVCVFMQTIMTPQQIRRYPPRAAIRREGQDLHLTFIRYTHKISSFSVYNAMKNYSVLDSYIK